MKPVYKICINPKVVAKCCHRTSLVQECSRTLSFSMNILLYVHFLVFNIVRATCHAQNVQPSSHLIGKWTINDQGLMS